MSRPRTIATLLMSALLVQLFVAMPALAVGQILAARCCDVDCPERPSAGTADRCCAIAGTPAANPTVRSFDTAASAAVVPVLAIEPAPAPAEPGFFLAPVANARAAPLYLTQRSLQL